VTLGRRVLVKSMRLRVPESRQITAGASRRLTGTSAARRADTATDRCRAGLGSAAASRALRQRNHRRDVRSRQFGVQPYAQPVARLGGNRGPAIGKVLWRGNSRG
jgi:hypothetical protein